jgi:ribonuclease J
LQFIPLGGLGEFGMNLMLYRWGDDCMVVDAGMMFPGEEHLGIDVAIPDLSFLDGCGTLHGVVLTHGHEDHIGALPYLLERHDLPVYGSPYTLGLVRRRLRERESSTRPRLVALDETAVTLGPFVVEPLPVAHSIPQTRMLVVRTPVGTVVHASDFKLDPDPLDGVTTDLDRLRQLGHEGVLALLSDSTNADRPGSTPGERGVAAEIDRLVGETAGRVIVTTFASHVDRLLQLGRIAARHGRKLALVGASLEGHLGVAESLGLLSFPPGTRIPSDRLADLPAASLLIVASGSQGEPTSAMARIAVGRHRQVQLDEGDLVIHSAREIPGNEKSIARMINHLLRRGVRVVSGADAPVHVSGHASADELKTMIDLLRPEFMIPIHGEYRQMAAHARLAIESGLPAEHVQLADSGDVIALSTQGISIVERVRVGQVFLDATADEVDRTVLRDRKRLAGDGIVVPVVAVRRDGGAVDGYPEIVARGFVPIRDEGDGRLMAEARRVVAKTLEDTSSEERRDESLLRARIQTELKRFLRRRTNRRPLVIPVILEI